jgi:hypothetical protein
VVFCPPPAAARRFERQAQLAVLVYEKSLRRKNVKVAEKLQAEEL